MEYDNTNTGALFKNDRKPEGSKQPDYRGEIDIDGRKLEIAAWLKTSAKGTKFMSLKVSEPRERTAPPDTHNLDDEIPF